MTVPVPGSLIYSYDEDGVTTVFSYPVRFLEPQELTVIREVDGVPTNLAYNVDYTVSGAGMPNGGSITRTAVTNGGKIIIARSTAWKQIVDLEDKARNPAEAVELQMDRLTMAGQDNARRVGVVEGQTAAIDDAVRRSEDAAERSESAEGGSEAAQQAAEAAQAAAEQAAGSVQYPVSYGVEQSLDEAQRIQARANIGSTRAVIGDYAAGTDGEKVMSPKLDAEARALQGFVDSNFQHGKAFWQNGTGLYAPVAGEIVETAHGTALRAVGSTIFYSRAMLPVDTSRVYRLSVKFRQVIDDANSTVRFGVRCYDASGVLTANSARYCVPRGKKITVADGVVEFSGYITGEDASIPEWITPFDVGTKYVRIFGLVNHASGAGTCDIIEASGLEDVTEQFFMGGERDAANFPVILKNRKSWPLSAFKRGAGLGIEANDSAAMRNMISSGEKIIDVDGVTFLLEKGTYELNTDTLLSGSGRSSVLKMNDPTQNTSLIRIKSGCALKGFGLLAPQDTVASVLSGQTAIDTGNAGADIEGVTFEDLRIQGFRWYGVNAHRMKNFRSRGVHQKNIGRAGWIMVGGEDCVHYGDTVRNVGPGSGGNAPLINAYGFNYGNDGAPTGFPVPKDIYFINCGVEDIPTWTAFDSHGSDNFNVINCWTRRVCNPIYLGPSSGTNEDGAFNWSVIGGAFLADGIQYRRGGILATWKAGSIGGTGGRIIGPTIDGYGLNPALEAASALNLEGAIHLAYQSGVIIDSPNIRNFNQAGVLFRREVTDTVLRGHNIVNGVATQGRADAILVAEAQNTSVVIHPGYVRRTGGAQLRGVVSEGAGATSFYGARVHGQDMIGVQTPYVQTVPFVAPGPNP